MSRALDIHAVKQCKACLTLSEDYVPAVGNPHADIMIVGGASTARDAADGHPFAGPCGEILDMMLDQAGLNREQVYITNALKCAPPDKRSGNPEEFEMCFGTWLKKELKFVNPSIVVLVGADAWMAVTRGKIKFKHNEAVKGKNRTFLTVYHPGHFIRRGDIESFVDTVGNKLKELYGSVE
jgi:DNA polymerase